MSSITWNSARLEVIVDAEAEQVGGEPVGGAGHREAAVREVEVKPLGLGRPMRREADFDAGAGGPADAAARLRQVAGAVHGQAADGEAGGAVHQRIADGDAGAA